MSIQIGTTPIYQPRDTIIEVQSDRSNAIRLNSTSDNIYIDMGDFELGQTSNVSEKYFVIKDTSVDEEIIKFSKDNISLLKPIKATLALTFENSLIVNSNLSAQAIATCNLTIQNEITGFPTAQLFTSGDGYFNGAIGIGMTYSSNFSLAVASNAHIGGSLYSSNLYTNLVGYEPEGISKIIITSNTIALTAENVAITNLNIVGTSVFDTLEVTNLAQFNGPTYSSNLILTNRNTTSIPFLLQQKRINNQFGDIVNGVPISVTADFETVNNTRILQVSPYGHLVLGGVTTEGDHLITSRIQGFRDSYFSGFMSFTNSNTNKDSFTVNKNANLSIGNPNSTSMFEIRNNYIGNEQYYSPPTAMIQLKNTYEQNRIPLLNYKLPNDTTRLQITSNATLVFNNRPNDMYKFDIETSNTVYLDKIETNSIRGFTNSNIDVNFSSFNRVNDIRAESATMSNVYIYTLTVDDIITDSLACFETLNDPEELRILSTKMLINSSNVVINRSGGFFSSNETSNLSGDTMRIYTSGTTSETISALHSIGNNAEITNRITNNNTVVNSKANTDYVVNQNMFKIGITNKSTSPNTDAHMYISPFVNLADSGINNSTAAINIFRDRSIRFGNVNFLHPSGYLTIGRDTIQLDNRLYVKGNALFLTSSDDPSMSIATANPYVGINTTIPTTNLHVHNGNVLMTHNNNPRFSIQSGNVGIGTTAGTYPFLVNLASGFTQEVVFSSNVSIGGRLDTLGNVASTSDRTVKTDLKVIENALDKIESLSGYIYRRTDTGLNETGLLAQEVKEVLPEAVYQADNGMYSLAYGNLAGLFVEAIKELKHRIEKIEAKLT